RLSLDENEAVIAVRLTVPSALLQKRAATDLGRGDDDRLRTAQLTFRVSNSVGATGVSSVLETTTHGRDARGTPESSPSAERPHSKLMDLLDDRHGFGVLLVLATLFGAAHALTPGPGK